MNTKFEIGQVVIARQSVQGMTRGQHYRVAGVTEQPTAFGNFVTYQLEYGHISLSVVNGHLLLTPATPEQEPSAREIRAALWNRRK